MVAGIEALFRLPYLACVSLGTLSGGKSRRLVIELRRYLLAVKNEIVY